MKRLHVLTTSTRPGRVGPAVTDWFAGLAREHAGFDVHAVDLAEFELPLLDEAEHPSSGIYTQEHTKRWSESVDAADAFVFVTPEYNYAMAPSLLNALDFLYREWQYKPVGFLSYGNTSAGLRGVQMAKQVVTTLKMMPTSEVVAVHFIGQHLGEDGVFTPAPQHSEAGKSMLDELVRLADAFAPLRESS